MSLSRIGGIVRTCWLDIPTHAPGARLDAFVVMPNHLHGILRLEPSGETSAPSLPAAIGGFNAAVSRQVRGEIWQRSYFEPVLRDVPELNGYRDYIQANPANWAFDAANPGLRKARSAGRGNRL